MAHQIFLKRRLLAVFLVFLAACPVFAGETGKIAGKVIDKTSGEPLPGANIVLEGTNLGAASDVNGDYFIINVPPGLHRVRASFVGYQTEIQQDVRVQVDRTTPLNFALSEEAISAEEVVVVAYRPETVEQDLTATKQTYDVAEIEDLPGINDVGDIINLQADVSDGHFRGGRAGEAVYLINGASLRNPLSNSTAFEPLTIGLQQVEVYTSGFSAEYGNVQSGVINMVAKEGRSDKWETTIDASTTNSYYKTHGGSVFSEDYIDYFDRLNSTEEWAFGKDPISGVDLWAHFGLSFDRYLPDAPIVFPPQPISREDSLRTADLTRILWLQSVRDIGLEYDAPDYRVEFSSGGPLVKNTTMFIAGQHNVSQPFLPTGRPNLSQQLMSNITYHANASSKIKLLYNFSNGFSNGITSNYFRWFERATNVTKQTRSTHQVGLAWNKVLNPSTFVDLKISQLFTREEDKIDLLGDSTFTQLYTDRINWRDYTAPTGYQIGKLQTTSGSEKTNTLTFNGSLTSQINKNNLLKAGFQFYRYDIDVAYLRSRSNASQLRLENYKKTPFEGAFYVQDKLEFEGMIANLGMRYDFYDLNTQFFTNKFSPYLNPNFDPTDPEQGAFYDESLAATQNTSLRHHFQPRIGISFPVSDQAVLHLNYGVFTQRPAFEYIFVNRLRYQGTPDYERLGNPELEPERTISYDIGLVRALPLGFYLDVSAYLKDVSNLLQFAVYEDNGGNRYFTFDNREYANVKGFHVNLEKNLGWLRGYVRYNWEAAKGKSGGAIGSGARAEFFENDALDDILPSPKDIFLDFDRTHKLVGNLSLRTNKNAGFSLFGFHPFGDLSISGTYRLSSGRPFTWDPSGQGLQMNQRSPTEHDLRARLNKTVSINGTGAKFYAEAFNLLNKRFFNYGRTFQDPQGEQNTFKIRYMEDRENLLTQTEFAPYFTSLEGYLFGNQPRHYRFGIEFDF